MFEPGYYKTNYRALRLRETVRWYGWTRGVRAWIETRFKPMSRGGVWMPGLWAENECAPEALSADFWQATKPHRADFEKLGFVQCHLSRPTRTLNPIILDHGAIFYLDPTRCYFGQLFYSRVYSQAQRRTINQIQIAFTAVFQDGALSCTNRSTGFDSPALDKIIRLNSYDLPVIYNRFREELQKSQEAPRAFPDLESLREWFDARQVMKFEGQVRRGLFVRMTEPEIAAAKAGAQSGGQTPQPLPRRRFRLEVLPTTLVLILLVSLILHRHREISTGPVNLAGNTIQYHGQQFKMRLPYAEYEDYKDDPNNLDTNDLSRIEHTMEAVKIPASFKDRKDFIHFIFFDLEFPGYGVGGIGANIQSDDGSTFDAESVEIPQAGRDRVVVVRDESNGSLKLVDDFIFENNDTNSISRVLLQHGQLEYFDAAGRLFRTKAI